MALEPVPLLYIAELQIFWITSLQKYLRYPDS